MNTTSKIARRPLVTLHLPKNVPALVTLGQNIVQAVTDNPSFPSPVPPLAVVTDALQELQAAQTATLSRARGTVTIRDEKRGSLVKVLQELRGYVQTRADASPETSGSIIEGAGMAVKATPVPPARVFSAVPGAVSGTVSLRTRAVARRASYEWQYSLDAGKTWIAAPITIQAKTSVSGLSPGATVAFRYRAATKDGEGDWSQPVTLLVR